MVAKSSSDEGRDAARLYARSEVATGSGDAAVAGRSAAPSTIDRRRLPDSDVIGREMLELMRELCPICRSRPSAGRRSFDGVRVTPLRRIPDERGTIYHMLRYTDPHFHGLGEIYLRRLRA